MLSVCKVLPLKSAERNEYGKTEMSTICLKGKISGSLLPSMNSRILSLSTERLTSCERKRNAIERLCVRKCFTKKKSKKIKMKKRKKNSSFVVITSRGNTVAWSVNYSVPIPWTSGPLACVTKRCHIYLPPCRLPQRNQKWLPGEHFAGSGLAI